MTRLAIAGALYLASLGCLVAAWILSRKDAKRAAEHERKIGLFERRREEDRRHEVGESPWGAERRAAERRKM